MFRIFGTILLVMTVLSSAWAQPGKGDSTLVFKVNKKKFEVSVSPADTVIWTNLPNYFTIRIADGGKISRVVMQGATVSRIDSISFSVRVKEGELATMAVYRRLPRKKEKLVLTQQYVIKSVPAPTLSVCGVKSDSTIDPKQLIEVNELTAEIEGFDSIPVEVIAFKMIHFVDGAPDTLITAGNRFSPPMKRAIHKLTPGQQLYFEEVWTQDQNGKRYMTNNVQLFIDETNKYKVGEHNVPDQ